METDGGIEMSLYTNDHLLIEQRVTNEGPSVAAAYLLWIFLGFVSGHRFYLGRPLTALLQALLNFLVVGWIWTVIDLFLIPGMIRDKQDQIRARTERAIRRRAVLSA
jgi:TM2 domain-containing membrane protein YozV